MLSKTGIFAFAFFVSASLFAGRYDSSREYHAHRYLYTTMPAMEPKATYAKLKELVRDKNVNTTEELLKAIQYDPTMTEMLSHPVLMHSSLSNQSAHVKPDQPRVILRKDNMIIAITAGPDGIGTGSVEIQEYNPKSGKFEFHEMNLGGKGKREIHDHPKTDCNSCHDGRPIWSTYRNWPGTFGSRDDRYHYPNDAAMGVTTDEEKLLRDFVAKNGKKGIYRYLDFGDYATVKRGSENRTRGLPNTFLTHYLNQLNHHRIYMELKKNGNYEKYRYVLLAAAGLCKNIDTFLPSADKRAHERKVAGRISGLSEDPDKSLLEKIHLDMSERNKERNAQKMALQKELLGAKNAPDAVFNGPASSLEVIGSDPTKGLERFAAIRYVVEGMGIDAATFSIDREPGETSFQMLGAVGDIDDMYKAYLLPDFKQHTPASGKVELKLQESRDLTQADCEELKKLSLAAFDGEPPAKPKDPANH